MAKQFNPHRYTRNRIGDWIDNNALAELKRDEKLLEQEKNVNLQRLRENHRMQEQIFRDGMTRLISEMTAQKKELEDKLDAEKERREIAERNLKEQIVQLVKQNGDLKGQVKELVHQLNKFVEEKRHNAQIAKKYTQEAIAQYQKIKSNQICIKFSGDKLIKVENLMSRLNAPNLSSEAQQAIAITILSDIFELKHHAERENKKFLAKYSSIKEKVDVFWTSLNVVFYFDNEFPLDMDHWTNNQFTDLYQATEQLLSRIEKGIYAVDYQIAQIKEDEVFLDSLKSQKELLIKQAKSRVLLSRKLVKFGQMAIGCLTEKEKFSEHICKFENDDDRGILVVELVREWDKKKLTLLFSPESAIPSAPLCIFRQGGFMNADEYQAFCKGIYDSLKKAGIVITFNDPKFQLLKYEDETFVLGGNQLCENLQNIISLTYKHKKGYE